MAKRFKDIYKKNIQSILKNGKLRVEKFIRKFEDTLHYQKAMEILKKVED